MTDEMTNPGLVQHGMAPSDRPTVLRPLTFEAVMQFAEVLAKSSLVPKEYQGNPANIVVAMQYGAEIGLHAMQALQSIAVIGGKPALYGDAGLAIVQSHREFEWIHEQDDLTTQTATCTIQRKGWDAVVRRFSQADAERIQVYEGGGLRPLASRTMWKNYPVRMRQMRARWWAMRDCFADALKGIIGREEMEGHVEPPDAGNGDAFDYLRPQPPQAGPVIDVKPEPPDPPLVSGLVAEEAAAVYDQQEQLFPAGAPPTPPPEATVFDLNGQHFVTKGITRKQMLESFELVGAIHSKKKGVAAKILHDEYGVATRSDLTTSEAEKYLARLRQVRQELEQEKA